jgi:lipoprotein-anchoring transpeptidase ErfK/SrfK
VQVEQTEPATMSDGAGDRRARRVLRRTAVLLATAGLALTGAAQPQAYAQARPKATPAHGRVEARGRVEAHGRAEAHGRTAGHGRAQWHGRMSAHTAPVRPTAAFCPTDAGRVACVDLTHQRMWVQNGAKVVFGPVPIRSGRHGYITRTGLFHVYWRDRHHWSTLYHVAMPYSQFFSGGEAFHSVNDPLSGTPGSRGCVNMTRSDARALWSVLQLHDSVRVFGHRSGS